CFAERKTRCPAIIGYTGRRGTAGPEDPGLEAEMKKFVIAGTLVSAMALGGTALAQSATPAAQQPAAGAAKQPPTTKQGSTKAGTKQGAAGSTSGSQAGSTAEQP